MRESAFDDLDAFGRWAIEVSGTGRLARAGCCEAVELSER